jgi:type IV secretory pathway VirB4 component
MRSGKSFLVKFLTTHAQKYDPFTVVLDLGHSHPKLATLLRGRYLEIRLRKGTATINPFAFEPSPEHLHFLHAFVRMLLEPASPFSINRARPESGQPYQREGLRRRSASWGTVHECPVTLQNR